MALAGVLGMTVLAQQAPPRTGGQSPAPPGEVTAQAPADGQAPSPAEPTPTFRGGINFVRVDVIVTDRNGNPAIDLTAADFEVREDGAVQTIEQFRLLRVDPVQRATDEPLRPIRNEDDLVREASRDDVRLFVIFFDDYHTREINALVVKKPLIDFVQRQVGPKDLVAFMYPMSPLDTITFTRDRDLMVSAIENFEGRKYDYEPRNQMEERYAHYPTEEVERIRNDVVRGGLGAIATRLGGIREGRKAIVLVSEGFSTALPQYMRNRNAQAPIPESTRPDSPFEDTQDFFRQTEVLDDLREITSAANRANTTIYTLDPRGLATGEFHIDEIATRDQDRQILQFSQDSLRILAQDTDGRAIVNRNDLGRGLEQVVRDSSAYYLLGYSSQAPSDGKFHEIKVNLSGKARSRGLQVRARRGYIAPTDEDVRRATAPERPALPSPVAEALASMVSPAAASRVVRSWVGMSKGASGRTALTYVWEPLPATPSGRAEAPSGVRLLAATMSGDVLYRGTIGAAAAAGAAAAPSARATFDAPPGEVQLRISVEGEGGGVLDTEIRELQVPDLAAGPALSTPRVYRARTARDVQALAQNPDAVPLVGREFSRSERVLMRFDVYGGGTPTAALLNRTGDRMADVPVAPAAAGGTHQIDLPLGGIPPGEYLVEIAIGATSELVPLKVGS